MATSDTPEHAAKIVSWMARMYIKYEDCFQKVAHIESSTIESATFKMR